MVARRASDRLLLQPRGRLRHICHAAGRVGRPPSDGHTDSLTKRPPIVPPSVTIPFLPELGLEKNGHSRSRSYDSTPDAGRGCRPRVDTCGTGLPPGEACGWKVGRRGSQGDQERKEGSSARGRTDGRLHHGRRILDFSRRLTGRQAGPLRAARRSVHGPDRRRRHEADHRRHGVRHSAALFAGRIENRLHLRSERRGQPVDLERRRHRAAGDHKGQDADVPIPGVDAGWQLHHRLPSERAAARHEPVSVPRRRRQRREADG